MKTGYYKGISNADYHASDGVSKSGLDLIHKSPAQYLWSKNAPYDEDNRKALDIGTAFHTLILEPEQFKKDYFVMPEKLDRRTTEGKQAHKEITKGIQDKIVLTVEEYQKLSLMRESLLAHPHAKWLIEAEGDTEVSIYWREATTGELAKCRPDKLLDKHSCLIDLKTSGEINRLDKAYFDYRYHVQDAWYSTGYETELNEPLENFIFLVVSTKLNCGRYPVRLFELRPEVKERGRQEYLQDIAIYAECKRTNEWPAIESFSLPYYLEN